MNASAQKLNSESSSDVLLTMCDLQVEARTNDCLQPIVNNVDLTLRRGEVFGLIG